MTTTHNVTVTDYPGWWAFLDESMPQPKPDAEPCYIIAAALLDAEDCENVRWAVSKLARKRPTFHWKDAEPPQRHMAVQAIASLPTLHVLVVSAPLDEHKQERGRAHALERMLYELDQRGIDRVVLESRTTRQHRWDLKIINAAKAKRLISHHTQVEHAYPTDEPLLWLPDIMAGAIGSGVNRYFQTLEHLASVINVRLR